MSIASAQADNSLYCPHDKTKYIELMKKIFAKILTGYRAFREKYAHSDQSVMRYLSHHGQKPDIMVVACCDARVDPALILQCDPGDLFVVRNVANIVPPYQKDDAHHGTSAALEFGIRFLNIKHLILLGHSQCGGIEALFQNAARAQLAHNDFITNWVSQLSIPPGSTQMDDCAKAALQQSHQHCMTFPWIREKVLEKTLMIHLWFFDIEAGQIFTYSETEHRYHPLDALTLD